MDGKFKFFMTSSVVIGIILDMFLNQRRLYVTNDVNNSWLDFSWFSGQSFTHIFKEFGVCLLVVDNDIFTFLVRKSKWPPNSSRMSAEFFTAWLMIWLIFFTFQLYIFIKILRGSFTNYVLAFLTTYPLSFTLSIL